MPSVDVDTLSEREREVLLLVAEGYQTDEIARKTGRSPNTIDSQIRNARLKLGNLPRRAAARAVQEHHQSLANPSNGILPAGDGEAIEPSSKEAIDRPIKLREERATFIHEELSVVVRSAHESGGSHAHHRLITIMLILGITIAIIVILASTPAIVASFRAFGAWILSLY